MVIPDMTGAEDTIYLCNFRVSVDGDWLCLKELAEASGGQQPTSPLGTSQEGAAAHLALPPNLFTPYVPVAFGACASHSSNTLSMLK